MLPLSDIVAITIDISILTHYSTFKTHSHASLISHFHHPHNFLKILLSLFLCMLSLKKMMKSSRFILLLATTILCISLVTSEMKLSLEDYGVVDTTPTTKASVRPGPVEHGTPLNPYIPKAPPPPSSFSFSSSPPLPQEGG